MFSCQEHPGVVNILSYAVLVGFVLSLTPLRTGNGLSSLLFSVRGRLTRQPFWIVTITLSMVKSGWWVLIGLIPVIGWIWAIVEPGLAKGTDGQNRFGSPATAPDPAFAQA
jgi:hypothetical protein